MSKQEEVLLEISPKMAEGTLSGHVRKRINHLIESNLKSLEGKILTFLECITDSEIRQKSLKDVARQIVQDIRMSSYAYADGISDFVAKEADGWEYQGPTSRLGEYEELQYSYTRSKK